MDITSFRTSLRSLSYPSAGPDVEFPERSKEKNEKAKLRVTGDQKLKMVDQTFTANFENGV